jgi:Tol biopolymer transport system component
MFLKKCWRVPSHLLDLSSPGNDTVEDVVWSPDSHYFALLSFPLLPDACESIQSTGRVYLMTSKTWQVDKELRAGPSLLTAYTTWSPSGSKIAKAHLDSFFPDQAHQVVSDKKGRSVYLTNQGFTRSHTWSPDGRWLVAVNVGGLRVWKCSS